MDMENRGRLAETTTYFISQLPIVELHGVITANILPLVLMMIV